MKIGSLGGLMTIFIMSSVSGASGESVCVTEGRLAPCPDSPNCVSTQGKTERHAMQPLPYLKTREASMERILSILKAMKRMDIVVLADSYIHAEFRTSLWRFVDDVEFFLDDTARVVHFRSASRVGYYDFGLNRRRMKKISEKYLEAIKKESLSGGP